VKGIQELSNSIKRLNLRTMGIEEGEEVQAKGISDIFNKIITENFPNLKKVLPIQVQETSRTPNRLDQNRTSLQYIIIKTISIENQERILKAIRDKIIMYKGKPIKITADFSMETLKARRAWWEVFQALGENNFSSRMFYPAKLLFKTDRAIKIFHDKQKLKHIQPPSHQYRRFYKEFCMQNMKANKTNRGQEISNHRRRKNK
jgi:hypothetical protein